MREQARSSVYASFSTRFAGAIAIAIGLLRRNARGDIRWAHKSTKRQLQRVAMLFAKQTEKGERSHRGKLACIRDLPHLFHIDCRDKNAANFQCQNWLSGGL